MAHLIDKDALVAEINKRIIDAPVNNIGHQRVWAYNDVKDIIDTLKVKEVDLEKEIREEYLKHRCYGGRDNMLVILNEPQFNKTAKRFFELGLNASNPLTWEDIKQICDIAFEEACRLQRNMKGSLIYKEQHYQEVLKRFKAKK